MKHRFTAAAISLLCLAQMVALPVSAQTNTNSRGGFLSGSNLNAVSNNTGISQISGNQLPSVIARVIGVFTGFLGLILLGYIIYAGFLWMTAGDEKQVATAKSMIKNAVIGLVIIALSYTIASFVINTLSGDILQQTTTSGGAVGH